MRKYIFIDNFRGFKNAYVPILDVNFLVGENSTGKTSFLGLVKLIASQRVMLHQDFGDEDVNFGNFSDMVSAHSVDRSYFSIGVTQEYKAEKNSDVAVSAALLTYKEHEGLPRLSRFTATLGSKEISLMFNGRTVLYRSDIALTATTGIEDMVRKIMPRWVREHSSKQRNDPRYKQLSLPPGIDNAPFYLPLEWILHKIERTQFMRIGGVALLGHDFGDEFVWVAPIRTKPRRTYDELRIEFSSEGLHTPYLIRRILTSKEDARDFLDAIRAVGSASGLFQSVQVRQFGNDVTAPFEVDIVLDKKALNLNTVGYGVSQSLPILVELLWRKTGSWFAVQQPEVHLHPRAQAALGDFIYELSVSQNKRFLIETHSDFTIDRFRLNYRKKLRARPASQILFFERRKKRNLVTPINIGAQGGLPSAQPSGYRKFFLKEELKLIGM